METELETANIEALVATEAAGYATAAELAALENARDEWIATLRRFLIETDEMLERAAHISGEERDQVLADLNDEKRRLKASLRRLTGEGDSQADERPAGEETVDAPLLQASWMPGHVVLWAGGPGVEPASADELDELVREAGGGTVAWERRKDVPLPNGQRAAALSAPVDGALGWLVGVGSGQLAADGALSLRWLGEVALWATQLVAQGRMVPTLHRVGAAGSGQGTVKFGVRWVPAAIDAEHLRELARRMPGAVTVLDTSAKAEALCRAVLTAGVDAVCRAGASRLVAPATVPIARTRGDVSEAVLAGLNGTPFPAAARPATDIADELKRWAAPVTGDGRVNLIVRLDAPEQDGGWLLSVDATGLERHPVPVERALADTSRAKVHEVETQVRRLERLLPALRRSSSRRGQVVLGTDEAWELMTETGAVLEAAGFEVRVPAMSRRRPSPRLRLVTDPSSGPSRVGAQQLSRVQWSVLFDDVELDAKQIAKLAKEARPLVHVKGRWVELDQADLQHAAAALAERANTTELSGAAILRHAVGLEGESLAGPVLVEGSGWAADLIRGATTNPPEPLDAPEGFNGELRHYQAAARGWLTFLDGADLGGCLAMDMGLGKTPTLLAHLLATRGEGPSLVIAPPAVLGNWAAEAARFTPGLIVRVHHGADRAEAEDLSKLAANADVVLTTYGTAVRDVDALAGIEWRRMVLDEAQAIKNPASETAQSLRRIQAHSRLALTGTPVENGLGDLWAILDFTNPGLVGPRTTFIQQLSRTAENGNRAAGEAALRALNGLLVFRRTKLEPLIAAELPDKIDELDHCGMTTEQIGLYQAVLDRLLADGLDPEDPTRRKGQVLAAITALKQICNHPAAYVSDDDKPLEGRSGKLTRLEEIIESVFAAEERILIFTHFAQWGDKLATYLSRRTGTPIACYHGGLARGTRDRIVQEFQDGTGAGALVLSLKAGGSGLNLTAANHVVLYDRWWNPAVEDQARDRAWRIGQTNTVISHRLVCPGTVDERVEEVVAGKRKIADLVLPANSTLSDLSADQLRVALGLSRDALLDVEGDTTGAKQESAA